MTINIIFSGESGGSSLTDTVDFGEAHPGDTTTWQDLFIRHDAVVSPITDCAFYLTRYVGSDYHGLDPDADIEEVFTWGDTAIGGFEMSQNPSGWTVGHRFDPGTWSFFRHTVGDVDNQIELAASAIIIGTPVAGEIPVAGEAHVQVDIKVPASPGSAGYRSVTLVFAYSATS